MVFVGCGSLKMVLHINKVGSDQVPQVKYRNSLIPTRTV